MHGNKLHRAGVTDECARMRMMPNKAPIHCPVIKRGCTQVERHVQMQGFAGDAVCGAVAALVQEEGELVYSSHIWAVWLPVVKGTVQR